MSNISDFNWFVSRQYLAAIMFHFANKPISHIWCQQVWSFKQMTCLIKKSFQNHYALQHLSFLPAQHLCICSIRRLFLDHFSAFHDFWAWFAGISRMWNEASSIWMFQRNTMFMFKALDLILWMRRQGSVLTRLSDKTLLWKKSSGGGERSPTLGKTLRASFFVVFAMSTRNFTPLLQYWKASEL